MNKRIIMFTVLIALFISQAFALNQPVDNSLPSKDYEKEWKKADSLIEKGLPQSALEVVDLIYKDARIKNNTAQFVKAVIYKLKLKTDYEEDAAVKCITDMEKEIASADDPVRSILHSMLAEIYWGYYQSNRYTILNRSVVVGYKSDDILTWDAKKIIEKVIFHYTQSLLNTIELKKIRVAVYDAIIEKGDASPKFRPTLYDFLAHRAIDFFMNSESGLTAPANKFVIDRDGYFGPANEFVKMKVSCSDDFSLKFYAVKLFQELLEFHIADQEPDALIDADMKRLQFMHQYSVSVINDSLYLQSLIALNNRFQGSAATANITYAIAFEYHTDAGQYNPLVSEKHKWSNKKALEICESTIKNYPGTDGAHNCEYLKTLILEKDLSLTTEYANLPDKPFRALLTYTNVPEVFIRVIELDPKKDRKLRDTYYNEALLEQYTRMNFDQQWSIKPPDDGDFQKHTTEIEMPKLPYGYYIILISDNSHFSFDNRPVAYSNTWCTAISYASRDKGDGAMEFDLLDRSSGQPISGVKAQTFVREYNYNSRLYEYRDWKSFTSDADGHFEVPPFKADNYSYKYFYADFSKGDDRLITNNYFYQYSFYPPDTTSYVRTFFFTDRAIYRPGQTIWFKGLVLDNHGGRYTVKSGYRTEVQLYDANYQLVTSLQLTTNDYGTVNGSFTAPANGITGQMYLTDGHGNVYFSVEEYKRPKFECSFEPVKGTYRLGDSVTVSARAKAYAGNNIDGAAVKYRVVREARYPYWNWYWYRPYPTSASVEIASGVAVTDENGQVKITFAATPDLSIARDDKPVFYYTVTADITDVNGETHTTSKSVAVGYTALQAGVSIDAEVNREGRKEFAISTTNLDGTTEHTTVNITIWPLKQPDKLFRSRLWSQPDKFMMSKEEYYSKFPLDIYRDETNMLLREKGSPLFNMNYDTGKDSVMKLNSMTQWAPGEYLLIISAVDRYGEKVERSIYFNVFSAAAANIPVNDFAWHSQLNTTCEPGEKASFLIGTRAENVRVLYELEVKGMIASREWITLNNEQKRIDIPVKEEYRGNFAYHLTFVKDNRSYQFDNVVYVPYTNRELDIEFESFRNKLLPGQQEEWKIKIRDQKGEKVAAEMLATLYDGSLDAFRANYWYFDLLSYYYNQRNWNATNAFGIVNSQLYIKKPENGIQPLIKSYDYLNWYGYYFGSNSYFGWEYDFDGSGGYGYAEGVGKGAREEAPPAPAAAGDGQQTKNHMKDGGGDVTTATGNTEFLPVDKVATDEERSKGPAESGNKDGGGIQVRSNFNETAFFFPTLQTDEKGEIIIKFTIPEALTKWKMMGIAHTKDLKYGQITKELVTQKDLMVVPNAPRFLRENDKMTFSAKISDVSDKDLEGTVSLEFFDAVTMNPLNSLMGNLNTLKPFSVKAGQSTLAEWDIAIPEGIGAIMYKVIAKAGSFSDGEEMALPVLTNRMLVTECLPLPVNGKQTKNFTFTKLVNSGASSTLKNFKLTLEFTSNPAWYAIQALPYMMEYPYECSEQVFNRYYANSIASFVVNSNPKIKQVFDNWKNFTPDALLSNLEKNQELKSLMLEETPWVLEAQDENERKHRVALLFDLNRMSNELGTAMTKLMRKQASNGGWPWFDGGPDDRYITQYIVTGLGHLDHLGIRSVRDDNRTLNMLKRAVVYLDDRIREDYEYIKKNYPKTMNDNHLGTTQIQYLYARSYFMDVVEPDGDNKTAFDYFKVQAQKYWNGTGKYMQGMIALSLHRLGDEAAPADIIRSLKETALHSEEMGMYWRDMQSGYYWYEAPIETQALLIECFDEVAADSRSVEEMKIWLLKQKQTQDWKTTKATAEACYALLLKGTDVLASDKLVEVSVGGQRIDPSKMDNVKVEAGTGYYKTSWAGSDISPEMGNVTVTKTDDGVAWGALYWQYFEQLDKITPAQTPLKLEKKLFREKNSPSGPVIEPVTEATVLKVGDKIKVRIELRVDRDMEYVHLKDMRASGFEPVNVISHYKYQDGLGYYESTRDAATNFFISYMPKGTYVFEYPVFVTHKGDFSNGITSIQCMYAPEFSAHSEGIRVKVSE